MGWTRWLSFLAAASLAAVALGACDGGGGGSDAGDGDDAGAAAGPYARLAWRMRCVEGRCPEPPSPERAIDAVDGVGGAEVRCDLTIEGDARRLVLTARDADGAGIEVRGAQIGLEGGRLMGSLCMMRVFEPDDATVFGTCSSNVPSADRPCQIQRVDIRDVDGVPTLTGELRCASVQVEGDSTRLRDVTSPTSSTEHAQFTFTGCEGL